MLTIEDADCMIGDILREHTKREPVSDKNVDQLFFENRSLLSRVWLKLDRISAIDRLGMLLECHENSYKKLPNKTPEFFAWLARRNFKQDAVEFPRYIFGEPLLSPPCADKNQDMRIRSGAAKIEMDAKPADARREFSLGNAES